MTIDFCLQKRILFKQAQMVELVDTLVSGTSAFSGMEVQVFFWAVSLIHCVARNYEKQAYPTTDGVSR